MDKHFTITVPIYNLCVEIFYNKGLKYIKKEVDEYIFAVVKQAKKTAQAIVVDSQSSNSITVVFYKHEANNEFAHGVIAHEMLHVTNRLMEKVGVESDNLNDEAHAYLLTFLTKTFYDTMDDKYDPESGGTIETVDEIEDDVDSDIAEVEQILEETNTEENDKE